MKILILFINLLGVAFLSSCAPTIDSRGYNPETLDISTIKIGIDTKQTIQERYGSPSTVSTFPNPYQGQSWYYVSKKTSTTSFHRPVTLEQQTVMIAFDPQGIVKEAKKADKGHEIQPVKRKTETTGYETSVLRDVFGNFGRYSQKTQR